MKYLLKLSMITLIAVAAGCSSGGENAQEQAQASVEESQAREHSAIEATKKAVAEVEGRQLEEGAEITVAGRLGCGHCTYHRGENCSAAIQTKDGAVFILDIAEESEWFKNRYDGTELEVTGKVRHRGSEVTLQTSSILEL